jgi:CheY-like chemotaxis protein
VANGELIRVLVVDDHRMVREGLRSYLELIDDIAMVGDASDGRSALDWLARAKAHGALPDVVLMDLLMEPMGGIEATAAIKERYPGVEVVAVTSFVEEDKVQCTPRWRPVPPATFSRTPRPTRLRLLCAPPSGGRFISTLPWHANSPRRCGEDRQPTPRRY